MATRRKQSTKGNIKKKVKNTDIKPVKKTNILKAKVVQRRKVQTKDLNKKIFVIKKKVEKRKYTTEALDKAVTASSNGMSYRAASALYKVPVTSIFRVVKNPDKQLSIITPPTVLSCDEEKKIVNWLLFRAESGFPATKSELLESVQSYILKLGRKTPFTDGRPGRHWYDGFQKRHPNVSIRTAQHLTLNRASVSEEDLREWFAALHKKLESKKLVYKHPSRVFNCDETNIQLLPKPEKVISQKGARSVYKIVDANEKESLTALFMYSADGTRVPPMVMYRYKEQIPPKILKHFPKEHLRIGFSDNGWMTSETFYEYITNVFFPWLKDKNVELPVILYLDGHASHINFPLLLLCKQNNIELVILYPNSTHIIQPLDISVFHPFKDVWRKMVPQWKTNNNISRLKQEHFAVVLKEALDAFVEEKKCVQSGFRASGLMPFNPNAVNFNVLKKDKKQSNQSTTATNPRDDKISLLQLFEDSLPDGLLQDFKEAEPSGMWINDVENLGLFNQWLRMKNVIHDIASSNNTKPTIEHIVKLTNHKIVLKPNSVPESMIDECISGSTSNMNDQIVLHINDNVFLNSLSSIEDDTIILPLDNNIIPLENLLILNNYSDENILSKCNEVFNESSEDSQNDWNSSQEVLKEKIIFNEDLQIDHDNLNSSESVLQKKVSLNVDLEKSYDSLNESEKLFKEEFILNKDALKSHDDSSHNIDKLLQEDILNKRFLESSNDTSNNSKKVLQEQLNKQQHLSVATVLSDTSESNKENFITVDSKNCENINQENRSNLNTFKECFTMPIEYIPKKKRVRLEASGKPKKPCAGHMDQFLEEYNKKLEEKKIKEENTAKKKLLQEEKKKLAEEKMAQKKLLQEEKRKLFEEKKSLQAKMTKINKKIKKEKT